MSPTRMKNGNSNETQISILFRNILIRTACVSARQKVRKGKTRKWKQANAQPQTHQQSRNDVNSCLSWACARKRGQAWVRVEEREKDRNDVHSQACSSTGSRQRMTKRSKRCAVASTVKHGLASKNDKKIETALVNLSLIHI